MNFLDSNSEDKKDVGVSDVEPINKCLTRYDIDKTSDIENYHNNSTDSARATKKLPPKTTAKSTSTVSCKARVLPMDKL